MINRLNQLHNEVKVIKEKTSNLFIDAKIKQLKIANEIKVRKQQMFLESLAC